MKSEQKTSAQHLRILGYSINEISTRLDVSKSTVSHWVRSVDLSDAQLKQLAAKPFSASAIEKRRLARIKNESNKRSIILEGARLSVGTISYRELSLIGMMLYWAEGGKTQRM